MCVWVYMGLEVVSLVLLVSVCLMAVIPLLYDLQNYLTQYIVMPDKL